MQARVAKGVLVSRFSVNQVRVKVVRVKVTRLARIFTASSLRPRVTKLE